jgi:hypothetical protein
VVATDGVLPEVRKWGKLPGYVTIELNFSHTRLYCLQDSSVLMNSPGSTILQVWYDLLKRGPWSE